MADSLVDEAGNFDREKAERAFKESHGLGQVGRPSSAGGGIGARKQAELTNAIQRFFIENSRLGIPVIFHEECLHGQAAIGGTSFPQPIALGASFNPGLVEALYSMTAREARVRGTHQALTPFVDVARDPRWGRDGVPSHPNTWLLRKILREDWGFKGFVVSGYYAIWELSDRPDTHGHRVAADKKEACTLAVRAGVNIELPEPDCYLHLVDLIREGTLEESLIDGLVAPMLHWKFQMGLFDDPYVAERIAGSESHRALALQTAQESITLLKNEDGLLPLNPNAAQTIAVIGPNANRSLLGGYSGKPNYDVTVPVLSQLSRIGNSSITCCTGFTSR